MVSHYPRRLLWVVLGMVVSAVGIVMMLQANIGLEPWSVLQQGMAQTFGITYGTASVIVGAAAIGVAILFGEGFGIGTILNITLCAIFIDFMLAHGWIPLMLELLAIGTWLYMKAALGAGPRDSLMVALARKSHHSVGLCRALVEIGVIIIGWLLGGQVGIGTVISAVVLGTLFNLNFALFRFRAAEVHQENLAESIRNLTKRGAPTNE